GIGAAGRAFGRVFREITRIRKLVASVGGGWRFRLGLLPAMAKCLYLVLFALGQHRWRNRHRYREAVKQGESKGC
ncbi:MAG: hypothetical protein IH614_13150, partial [Desulfuromonadales bacterium]|nr:hypothetical protein [Desulfuromonadales bacterium]